MSKMRRNEDGTSPALRLEGLCLHRGGIEVLHGIDLEIPAGSIVAVVGPSGAGKSSLLSTLNGLLRPSSGGVHLSDLGPLTGGRIAPHRRRTATVFQNHALVERLTVLDNVLLGMADARHPLSLLPWTREQTRRAAQAIDELGLLRYAHVRVDNLSGGERQRVGLARALVREPSLLLGDEPFASLDPQQGMHLGALVKGLARRKGLTVVLVMHQVELACAIADRIVGLNDGFVAFDGPCEDFDFTSRERVFAVSSEKGFQHAA